MAVFAQISSLRLKYGDKFESGFTDADVDKDAMDESATHVLFAAMLAFFNAAILVAGLAFSPPNNTDLGGVLGSISAALFVYMLCLILMLLPRLLHAYSTVNVVRKDLNGFHRQ